MDRKIEKRPETTIARPMPIKFRCEHCQQLLGISRTKAGQVADCPTCGRSVRVPELDGRRQPVPPPELNLKDSRLAGALDELAQIGLEPEGERAVAVPLEATSQKAEVITPDPLPDPVPIEPPPPLVEPRDAAFTAASAATAAASSSGSDEALADLARQARPQAGELPEPVYRRRRWKPTFSPLAIALLAIALAAGFGLGYLARGGRGIDVPPAANGSASAETPPAAAGNAARKAAIKGRITYKNEDGDRRPDRKARVLVFPQQRVGHRKLDVIGLRAGDAAEDYNSAAAAFRALGGDVTKVDDDGGFEISLPAAGTYQILVLSNYQPRDTDESIDAPLLQLLGEYFDRPQQLLGQFAYHTGQVRYKGAEPVLWDHSF